MKFQTGQQVLIKNPRPLSGIIVKARPGDTGLPEEQTHYLVEISERCFYLSSDLEAEAPNEKLETYSSEWTAQFNRMLKAAQRWLADANDRSAFDEMADAGRKIGWIVPIKKED